MRGVGRTNCKQDGGASKKDDTLAKLIEIGTRVERLKKLGNIGSFWSCMNTTGFEVIGEIRSSVSTGYTQRADLASCIFSKISGWVLVVCTSTTEKWSSMKQ